MGVAEDDEMQATAPSLSPSDEVGTEQSGEPAARTPRQRWMGLLARADDQQLAGRWKESGLDPEYRLLRAPESGMVMVRGRMGGAGRPFNVGEMTVTRAAVVLTDGTTGHAYVAGRRPEHARISAVLDALLQADGNDTEKPAAIIDELEAVDAKRLTRRQAAAERTRVDFFTMVRSE